MFTGLISEVGRVESVARSDAGLKLRLRAPRTARGLAVGGSVAVSGVCLSATRVGRTGFSADVIPETLRRSSLGGLAEGGRVNLERPLTPTAELGGHFVQGHVDAMAKVASLRTEGGETLLTVELPHTLEGLLVEKGSIAIDGVSLTVAWVARGSFGVALIPHTLERTTLGDLAPGDPVNLEADILAKYVRSLLGPGRRRK